MAYVSPNFKTKKALAEHLKRGLPVNVYEPSGLSPVPKDGEVSLEGPHFPAPHTWYAEGKMVDGKLASIR
jgi:hypothetical protein